jgi:hypothetical protein
LANEAQSLEIQTPIVNSTEMALLCWPIEKTVHVLFMAWELRIDRAPMRYACTGAFLISHINVYISRTIWIQNRP